MAYTIGLTGNIACGKSTVGRRLVELGAEYVDTDQVVHDLLGSDTSQAREIVERFGADIRAGSGGVDRKALGAVVFADPERLRELERILHPAVEEIVRQRIRSSTAPVVVIDGVKIVESGFADEMDELWVVTCSEAAQRERLRRDRGLGESEVEARLGSQPPLTAKLARARVVIDNSGSRSATLRQVDQAYERVLAHLPTLNH